VTQPDENDSSAQNTSAPESTAQHPSSNYPTAQYAGPPQSQAYPPQDAQSTGYGYGEQTGYPAAPAAQPPGYGPGPESPPGYSSGPGGYPAPDGYPPYGSGYGYQMQRGPSRPGSATASAVLMFIQAAVVLFSTFYVLFFASLAGSASAAGVPEADQYETEFTVIGILQLVSVGLLIFGGVQLLGGSATGRVLTIVACGIQLAFVVYWMIRIGSLPDFDVDGSTFFFVVPLMYAVLPLVALPLALGRPVTEYLAAKQRGSHPAA